MSGTLTFTQVLWLLIEQYKRDGEFICRKVLTDKTQNKFGFSLELIEPDLLDQGIAQLSLECQIITDWLSSLDSTESEPRRAYEDMLRSRHEILLFLEQLDCMHQSST